MRLKFTLLCLFLITVTSCTTIKQLSNEKITATKACSKNDFDERMIYYTAKIDGKEEKFLFDTGATMAVITDSTAITAMETKKFGNFGTVTGADKKTVDLKTFTSKFESDLFYSDNKVFAYVPRKSAKCQSKEEYKGIVGLDVFLGEGSVLQLDFTNKKICNIGTSEINDLIRNGYVALKSQCKSKKIYIYITVDGKECQFKLDTGFSGSLVIPYADDLNFSKYHSITLEGELFKTIANNTMGIDNYYEDVPLNVGDGNINSIIQVSQTIKVQNAGMKFIKGFDWIIDYNNNKVYVKRNLNKIDANFNKNVFHYITAVKEDRLFISAKQQQLKEFNLNDEIIMVNKQKVTPDNICQLQELLNSTKDWKTIELEVIPFKK